MDLLTGLLLAGVVIWIAYIVVRALFDESITEASSRYFRSAENPVESSLIGSVGKVVDSGEGDQMKVRIGIELWSARLVPDSTLQLAVGSEVRVTAVNGMLLDVEEQLPA